MSPDLPIWAPRGALEEAFRLVWDRLPFHVRCALEVQKPTIRVVPSDEMSTRFGYSPDGEFVGILDAGRVRQEIRLRPGLRPLEKFVFLAHELAHCYLQHGLFDVLMADALSPREYMAVKQAQEDEADYLVVCEWGFAAEFERMLERSDRREFLQPRWWQPEMKREAILRLEA